MIKKLFSYFKEKTTPEKGNEIFDASNPGNSDAAISRSINSIKLLKDKLILLQQLVGYDTSSNKKEETEKNNLEISGYVDLLNGLIFHLHELAFTIVNNPKYQQKLGKPIYPTGYDLNLTFLSPMNAIVCGENNKNEKRFFAIKKTLKFDKNNPNRAELYNEINRILVELKKIKIL